MKYVTIEDIEPGQILGKTVYTANGTVLLSAGMQLTVYMISTLKRIGVTVLYIEDQLFEDVELEEEVVSPKLKQAIFREMYELSQSLKSGKDFNTASIATNVDMLLNSVLENKDVALHLAEIRTADNAEYIHALNVCLISSMIGINMKLNPSQLKELAIGALLHDIGKAVPESRVPLEKGKEHHTWRGYEMLRQKREWSLLVAHIALQHHEQLNGSGEPRGITGDAIHQYAKIVAVANTYDNRISGNPLTGIPPMLPHEACEQLMAASERELDRDILVEFMRIVSIYPNGTSVRLSTKETGVVVRQHRGLPGRPVIRIVRKTDEDLEIKEVDLSSETTVFIEAVLS
ncbi:HD-GYP domain-containing protein [Paenibacillus physcomitrellae]|uniref:C-di-GMP phosphodiesterase n=1 Tax=Paenibacillus physcomitrellae TaxID=1619311 RepID=A0ABQ1GTL8_9BACL|nr:HD domain-containing phosphohydrolase [Paenibacillus physcomitrellae]GGA50154.1 c-di-GMP phosphodiesterase [Paenibacillus physcomitrellae]